MKRFGLLHHPEIPEAQRLAQTAAAKLQDLGATVWLSSAHEESELLARVQELDMLISFGGDGTIVRLARVTAGMGLPILGINLGRVGFLAELQPWEVCGRLEALIKGQFWLEGRMMLRASLRRGDQALRTFDALNDVVVSRGRAARVLRVEAYVDGQYVTTYTADGVIVATPTGSTAYSLAAGGPIVSPELTNLLLTPIAPHLAVATSLVLPGTAHVQLSLANNYNAVLTVDGQVDVDLGQSDVVCVAASHNVCYFVRMGERNYFYKTLLQKLR